MYKIKIEDIEKENNKILHFVFDDEIQELEDCKVHAELDFKSLGDYIEVKGFAKGTLSLECDRCLKKFNHDFDFEIDELYAKYSLYEEYGQEVELQSGQFVTDLNGEKEIDVYDLLYQSVTLSLPNKKVCGINCNEGLIISEDVIKVHDNRMDVFKNIPINNEK